MLRRAALFLVAVPLFSQVPFNEMIVFGDSLSDNGNLYIGTTRLGLPTPGPPGYTKGKYTDGADSVPATTAPLGLWIEQLAVKMNLPVPQPFLNNGTNYAVAGAVTGHNPAYTSTTSIAIPSLTDQLGNFTAMNHTPPANALYVIWCGSNDLLNSADPGAAAATAVSNIQGNIDTLATAGAKYFLWVNLPLVGEVPERINTANSAALDQAAAAYNQAISGVIAKLKATHPGITVVVVDSYSLFGAIAQNPSAYGFTNVSSPAQGTTGINPNTYLFWDKLHPTTVGHSYVASIAYSAILSAFGGPAYTCSNTLTPVIAGVDSASAYGGYSYFTSGSWLEIKGSYLADPTDPRLNNATVSTQWTTSDFNGPNAPTSLDGISVSINGKPAYVWYVSPTQLNVQAPQDSAQGPVAITVTNCKATSAPAMLPRQPLAPGLLAPSNYTVNSKPYMVATFVSDGAYVLNTSAGAGFGLTSRPAKPGDQIIAYGVGFGDVTPSILPGVVVGQGNQLVNPVTFSFGSAQAALSYWGLAGSFVGLYEFYLTVPAGLANGDYQINVTENGVALPQTMYLSVQN